MRKREKRTIRLIAKKGMNPLLFDIYVHVDGREAYLMSQKYNPHIYEVLAKGVGIKEFIRAKKGIISSIAMTGHRLGKGQRNLKVQKNYSRRLENSMNHIVLVMNDYLEHEHAGGATA